MSLHQCTRLRIKSALCVTQSKHCDCCCVVLLQPAAAKYFSPGQPGLLPAAAYFISHPQDVSGRSHASITSCCTYGEPDALVVILSECPLVMSIHATYFSMSCCYAGDSPHDCCMPGLCCIVRSHQLHYVLMHMLGSLV